MAAEDRRSRWISRVIMVAGVILGCCGSGVGWLGYAGLGLFGVGVVVVGLGWLADSGAGPGLRFGTGVPLSLLLGAAVVATILGGMGLAIRQFDPGDYYAYAGDKVTATLVDECHGPKVIRRRSLHRSQMRCEHATWTADGRLHVGTITIDTHEMDSVGRDPDTVTAYVRGDDGYSEYIGNFPPAGSLGRFPLWLLLTSLSVAMIALSGFGRIFKQGPFY